jgi:neutral ceramidase
VAPGQTIHIAISDLTNTYSSYTSTYEEYQAQRYEAASTIFGLYTLDGNFQEFCRYAKDMASGQPSAPSPNPPDLEDKLIQLMSEARFDRIPEGKSFGGVIESKDTKAPYKAGEEVAVKFYGANPRNNQGSYLTVEYITPGAKIRKTFLNDADSHSRFLLDCGIHNSWRQDLEDIFERC